MPEQFQPEAIGKLPYQTPYFFFSDARLEENVRSFNAHFPGAEICYAMKSNSESHVLETLYKAGAGFEVASIYELDILKGIGVAPERIIYGTSVKPAAHIKIFFEYGVRRFAFDSLPELEKIAENAPGSMVYVRVMADDSGSIFSMNEKFSTPKTNVVPFLQRAKELGLVPYGASFNVGSQALNARVWAEEIEKIGPELEKLADAGIEIQALNIGGGFPQEYPSTEKTPLIEHYAPETMKAYESLKAKPPVLILEPGRALVANAAVLMASVIARVTRGSDEWLFLDAGAYNALFETMAYQGSMRYEIASARPSYDAGEKLFVLAGPTGDSIDTITKEARLPADMNVGDKIIVRDVGAYSLVLTTPFNGFPKPDVHYA